MLLCHIFMLYPPVLLAVFHQQFLFEKVHKADKIFVAILCYQCVFEHVLQQTGSSLLSYEML
jgi:hypothetical protein